MGNITVTLPYSYVVLPGKRLWYKISAGEIEQFAALQGKSSHSAICYESGLVYCDLVGRVICLKGDREISPDTDNMGIMLASRLFSLARDRTCNPFELFVMRNYLAWIDIRGVGVNLESPHGTVCRLGFSFKYPLFPSAFIPQYTDGDEGTATDILHNKRIFAVKWENTRMGDRMYSLSYVARENKVGVEVRKILLPGLMGGLLCIYYDPQTRPLWVFPTKIRKPQIHIEGEWIYLSSYPDILEEHEITIDVFNVASGYIKTWKMSVDKDEVRIVDEKSEVLQQASSLCLQCRGEGQSITIPDDDSLLWGAFLCSPEFSGNKVGPSWLPENVRVWW